MFTQVLGEPQRPWATCGRLSCAGSGVRLGGGWGIWKSTEQGFGGDTERQTVTRRVGHLSPARQSQGGGVLTPRPRLCCCVTGVCPVGLPLAVL